MNAEFKKDSYISYNTLWAGIIGGSESMEYVVPDSMPDIGTILDTDAVISIRSKETLNGKLRAVCDLNVSIFYQPEDGTEPRFLSISFSCETSASAAEIDSNSQSIVSLRLRNLDTKVLNSRKISVSADIIGNAQCFRRGELLLASNADTQEYSLEIQKQSAEICLISDIREKTFVFSEDIPLPAGFENAERIAMQRVALETTECEFIGGKLVFRGKANIFLLVAGEGKYYPYHHICEFSQVMEVEGSSVPGPEISLILTGAFFDLPEHSGGKMTAELHILAQIQCWSKEELEYIADVYSTQKIVEPVYQDDGYCADFRDHEFRRSMVFQADLSPDAAEVLYIKPYLTSVTSDDHHLQLSCGARVVYQCLDKSFASTNLRVKEVIDIDILKEDIIHVHSVSFGESVFSVTGNKLDLCVPYSLRLRINRQFLLHHVSSVTEQDGELPEIPSLTLRRISRQSDLWEIAKQYRSNICAITAANNGREEGIILIPKTR